MSDKAIDYQDWIGERKDVHIFLQPWFLNMSSLFGKFRYLKHKKGNETLSIWPVFYDKKMKFKRALCAPLTKWSNPLFNSNLSKSKKEKISKSLIEQLNKFDFIHLNLHYNVEHSMHFQWKKFEVNPAYSYVIDLNLETQDLLSNLSRSYQKEIIPRLKNKIRVEQSNDYKTAAKLQYETYVANGYKPPFDQRYLETHMETISQHNSGQLLLAYLRDEVVSMVFLIWDYDRVYYHLSGSSEVGKQMQANVFLTWESIKYAQENKLADTFDFEGSMLPSVAMSRRQFGAIPKQYFTIQKYNSKLYKYFSKFK